MDKRLLMIILAILLAPLAVFIKRGAGKDLLINILLCFLALVPGVIHAIWIVTDPQN